MLNKGRIIQLAAAIMLFSLPAHADSSQEAKAQPIPTQSTAAAATLRVGYVDILQIAEKSDPGKAARSQFEARADKLKAQIESKQKLLEKQKTALEAKLPTYSPEQRAVKIKEYEKKVGELRKLLEKADKELKPLQEELQKEIYAKIEKAATEYGAANGFSVIVTKNELLYMGKSVDVQDVSEAIIKLLALK